MHQPILEVDPFKPVRPDQPAPTDQPVSLAGPSSSSLLGCSTSVAISSISPVTAISSTTIMVIEGYYFDFTGKRRKGKNKKKGDNPIAEKAKEKEGEGGESKVTLFGLLNFIDGIWSACAGELIVVFTTNHVDQLDLALIRRGRMDMHIEFSYCTFGAFKVLAKNYLGIDSHPLFEKRGELLDVTEMMPADVEENLTPKKLGAAVETCLEAVIHVPEIAKEARKIKAQKEEEQKETETESVPQ